MWSGRTSVGIGHQSIMHTIIVTASTIIHIQWGEGGGHCVSRCWQPGLGVWFVKGQNQNSGSVHRATQFPQEVSGQS